MPVDLIPDFIPVIGYLDDVLALLLALWAFNRLARPGLAIEIVQEIKDKEGRSSRAGRPDDGSGRQD
ncbi:MAG: DUF1232 domain-containing protein [Chloroflexota bacterium]